MKRWWYIKTLKKRQWLLIDMEMMEMSPKIYYEEIFREIIQEIKENEDSVEKH
ncbi:MAG: hypothetical protein ACFFA0_06910 [Promethearchaeota archaeon]